MLLSKKQKSVLCQIAGRAYKNQSKYGLVPTGMKLDTWRREETMRACAVGSMTILEQEDYTRLYNHFAHFAGEAMIVDRTYSKRDIWEHKINEAMYFYGFADQYAKEIVKDKFGFDLGIVGLKGVMINLSEIELKHLWFTLDRAIRRHLDKEKTKARA